MSGVLDTRYEINGVIDTNNNVLSNIESLCTAAGTWLTYDNHEGKWSFVINKAGASIASFTDSNIIGSITVSGTGLTDLYNSVRFEFPHIDINDQKDFIQIAIPLVDRNDNEPDNILNLQTEIINDPIQAEMIALIELKQSRVDSIINFTTDWSMIGLKAGDIIDITNSYYGYVNKKFRIITIQEVDSDGGSLEMNITALEYDENVYSTEDLSRYSVTNSTGIVTIGAIGVPGAPTVAVYNNDSRPRFVATSTAPTGIVEGIEYWYTTDVPPTVTIDANRTYKLLNTIRPKVGVVFTYGELVILDYDSLNTGNFLIKTRGINKGTTGPFSTPVGFVYTPLQTAGAIGSSTIVSDGAGLLTALTALSLLSKVDGLFGGNTAIGGLFDKAFELFKDTTGFDLRSNAGNIAKVTAGNVSSISKVIQAETFSSNIPKSAGSQTIHNTSISPIESGRYNLRIYQDVNSSACAGGRGLPLDATTDTAGLGFDLVLNGNTISSAGTGGAGVIYWQDFTVEKMMTLVGGNTYDLEIYANYIPNATGSYQTSDVTYTVTKIG